MFSVEVINNIFETVILRGRSVFSSDNFNLSVKHNIILHNFIMTTCFSAAIFRKFHDTVNFSTLCEGMRCHS